MVDYNEQIHGDYMSLVCPNKTSGKEALIHWDLTSKGYSESANFQAFPSLRRNVNPALPTIRQHEAANSVAEDKQG